MAPRIKPLLLMIVKSTLTWGLNSLAFGTFFGIIGFDILGQFHFFNPAMFIVSIFTMTLAWATLFLKIVIGPALLLGFLQAIWFSVENKNWGSIGDRLRFSVFSGIVLGLLCFAVDWILTGGFSHAELLWITMVGSLLGGAYGAFVNRSNFLPLPGDGKKTAWIRIFFSFSALVLCAVLLIYVFLGEKGSASIPAISSAFTTTTPWRRIPTPTPVPAQGSFLSGDFKLNNEDENVSFGEPVNNGVEHLEITKNEYWRIKDKPNERLYEDFIDRFHQFNQLLTMTQNGGVLTLKDYSGSEWTGTVNDQLEFKIDDKKVNGDVETNLRFEGKFHDRDNFSYYLSYWEQAGKSSRVSTCVGTGVRLK